MCDPEGLLRQRCLYPLCKSQARRHQYKSAVVLVLLPFVARLFSLSERSDTAWFPRDSRETLSLPAKTECTELSGSGAQWMVTCGLFRVIHLRPAQNGSYVFNEVKLLIASTTPFAFAVQPRNRSFLVSLSLTFVAHMNPPLECHQK